MKFSTRHSDREVQRIQQEVEDNLADKADLESLSLKTTALSETAPELTKMKDGDKQAYDDGTNQWLYLRIGARLFKLQLTEV